MNRVLAVVTVVSLFVAGIAIGALGMHIFQDRQIHHPDGPPGIGRGLVHRRLQRQLDLSPEQQRQIDAILRRSHDEAMGLRRDLHPRVMEIMDRAHEEIAAILTPEQHDEFQRILKDNRRRAEHFFLGPPGRGHHGRWGVPRHHHEPPGTDPPADPETE